MKAKICTIGFSKKSLRKFVELLKQENVHTVIDTRLHNTSQLSGYAKKMIYHSYWKFWALTTFTIRFLPQPRRFLKLIKIRKSLGKIMRKSIWIC